MMDRYKVVENKGLVDMEGGYPWDIEDTAITEKFENTCIGGFDDKEMAEKVVLYLNTMDSNNKLLREK